MLAQHQVVGVVAIEIEGVELVNHFAVLDFQSGAPHPLRAVVGRHPDDAGVQPQLSIFRLRKGNPRVAGDDDVRAGGLKIPLLAFPRRAAVHVFRHIEKTAVHHRALLAAEFKRQMFRQTLHPFDALFGNVDLQEGVPVFGKIGAAAALFKVAAAVRAAVAELDFHVARDAVDAPLADFRHHLLRLGAVGHGIAGVDDRFRRDVFIFRKFHQAFQRLQVGISAAEKEEFWVGDFGEVFCQFLLKIFNVSLYCAVALARR